MGGFTGTYWHGLGNRAECGGMPPDAYGERVWAETQADALAVSIAYGISPPQNNAETKRATKPDPRLRGAKRDVIRGKSDRRNR